MAFPISEGGQSTRKMAFPISEGAQSTRKMAFPILEGGQSTWKGAFPISKGGPGKFPDDMHMESDPDFRIHVMNCSGKPLAASHLLSAAGSMKAR
jgi:hypothetical protein